MRPGDTYDIPPKSLIASSIHKPIKLAHVVTVTDVDEDTSMITVICNCGACWAFKRD